MSNMGYLWLLIFPRIRNLKTHGPLRKSYQQSQQVCKNAPSIRATGLQAHRLCHEFCG